MAALIVIDSGILISSIFIELLTPQAKAVLGYWQQQNIQLIAPTLFRYEIAAVARKAVFQKRVSSEEGLRARDFMLTYPVQTYIDEALLKRAYDLATHYKRPTAYDSQYLALAERFKCDFWTADERLYNAVSHDLKWINWLGNFISPPSVPPSSRT